MLHIAPRLPRVPAEITPEWLGEALSADHPGVQVDTIEPRDTIWGTGTKVLLSVDEFGDTLTVDQVADGLLGQARRHAATWDTKPGSLPRTAVGGTARQAVEMFYTDEYWNSHFAQPGAPEIPKELQDPGRLSAANRVQWGQDDSGTLCLVHGDPHVGNTYIDSNGRLGYIDWQGYSLGRWSHDVPYVLCGALSVDTRRVHERDLLVHYLGALHAHGGPRSRWTRPGPTTSATSSTVPWRR